MNVNIGDVVSTLSDMLKKTFHVPIHSDETLEGFSMPCFFIKAVPTADFDTLNTVRMTLTIVLTYFTNKRNQKTYMEVEDQVREMLDIGFPVKDRFIHVDSLSDNRAGEDMDILQIEVACSYSNKTQRLLRKIEDEADPSKRADEVTVVVKNEKNERRQ